MGLFDAIGSVLGTNKSGEAIDAQTQGANAANATLKQVYDQQRADSQPYMQAGYGALSGMQDPNFQKDFTLADFNKDPGYQFRMDQGQQALERSAAAKGGLNSGGTMKALTQYGQDYGANQYQQAYENFNTNANNRFGRLSTVAGMGQNAINGVSNAASNYGNQVSQNQVGLGNANAAAKIGDANRNAGMISDIISGGSKMVAASDRRLKTEIRQASKEDLAEMRKYLTAYKFKYSDKKWGDGDYIGVMAQDLEKSPLGKTLVYEDKDGNKLLDTNRILMLFLATMAEA